MKNIAILFGLILIAVGLIGYFTQGQGVSSASEGAGEVSTSTDENGETASAKPAKRSFTALIPAIVGVLLGLCGVVAALNPSATKHAMHAAATFGLLGALAATGRGVPSLLKYLNDNESVNGRSLVFILLMAVVCWLFVALSIRSFVAARKARDASRQGS